MARNTLQSFVTRFPAREEIFAEGDLGSTMFIVQSGKIELFRDLDGQRRSLGVMEKGDFFGEMSILEGVPRTSSAETLEESELLEINSTTFDKMVRSNVEIAIRLLRKLSIRLRDLERQNAQLQASGAAPTSTSVGEQAPVVSRPTQVETGVRLVSDDGRVFPVIGAETLIGRFDPVTELRPDVDLSEVDLKRSVSRRHARIVLSDSTYSVIEEIGALNGTCVNGTELVTGQPHPLADGDTLSVGTVQMVFRI